MGLGPPLHVGVASCSITLLRLRRRLLAVAAATVLGCRAQSQAHGVQLRTFGLDDMHASSACSALELAAALWFGCACMIKVAIRIASSWTCLTSATCHVCRYVTHDALRCRQGERRDSGDSLDTVVAAAASCPNSRDCCASHWRRLSAFAADFAALASCSMVSPGALFTLEGLPDAAGDAASDAAVPFRLSAPAQMVADASITV